MIDPKRGQVLFRIKKTLSVPEQRRILWMNQSCDLLVAIEIPIPNSNTKNYYIGPRKFKYSEIIRQLHDLDIECRALQPPSIMLLTDPEIHNRYRPQKPRKDSELLVGGNALRKRDELHALIEPIINAINHDPASVYESELLSKLIKIRLHDIGKEMPSSTDGGPAPNLAYSGAKTLYNAVHRFLAHGCGKNGLLPCTFRSGAPGCERNQKQKLGRPPLDSKKDESEKIGFYLDDASKKMLQTGWRIYVRVGMSVADAYLRTMKAYWSRYSTNASDGPTRIELLDKSERPTLKQFQYWGPKAEGALTAWEAQLSEGEFQNKWAPILTSLQIQLKAVGQCGLGDSTQNDVHLVRVDDRTKVIGQASRLVIYDAKTTAITGFHIHIASANAEAALGAVLNSAEDKVDFCRRFGVDIKSDDFPSVFYQTLLVDNGEYKSDMVVETLTNLGMTVVFCPRAMPRAKAGVEGVHHTVQSNLDHKLPGTNHGRQRRRGESDSRLNACLTIYEYIKQLLIWIKRYNTEIVVSRLWTSEMGLDGLRPETLTRSQIHAWHVSKGRVVGIAHSRELLRARLLPSMNAIVRSDGLHLLRDDVKDARVFIPRLTYRPTDLHGHKLLRQASINGTFLVRASIDKFNLSECYLINSEGVLTFRSLQNDPLLLREGSLFDCLDIHDDERIGHRQTAGAREQNQLNFISTRDSISDSAIKAKQADLDSKGRKLSKRERLSNIEQNRADERSSMFVPEDQRPKEIPPVSDSGHKAPLDTIDSALDKHYSETHDDKNKK